MHNLITITKNTVNGETIQTVNARELHAFLESKQDFSTWIKKRILAYSFLEEQDFVRFHKKMEANNATTIDYHLTLDMAKELAMVERNEKGKQARQYFIECERRAKQVAAPQIDYSSPKAMIGFLKHLQGQIEQKDTTIAELKPKATAFESLTRSDGLFGLTEAAKVLEVRPKDLIDYLRGNDWVYRRAPGSPLLPYQDKIKRGLMDCPTIIIQRPDGTEKVLPSTKITTKGISILSQKLQKQSIH
ncbi:antA/AntB antirepressor family protein [Bartonella sp. B12(2025)]